MTVAEKPKARSGAAAGSVEHSGSLARGSCIDRYVVIDPLGQGGMGVVYAVYDPKLDRRVAIKLLRVDRGHRAGTERARQRLLREAQALAQLAHPNVVAVYDVGTFGDNVFMAMELVEGRTLRQLLVGGKQPSWRELLTMLIAAGRGLAAAHRAGLIHRDVKPDNIVLGNDGRVRMLDFGLARTADLDHEDEPAGESGESPPAPADLLDSGQRQLRSPLTEQGSVLGTPAYMAPEQEDGRAVDAACDQFSFCVTVYEALYGHLPGKHESSDGAPASARVPAWVRRILVRGMSAPPQERFPSMEALLDALARDPGARRRRLLAAAGFAATVAAATLLFMRAMPTRLCRGADEKLAGVWDDPTRDAVHRAFLSHGRGYAEETYQRVRQSLDAYLQGWVAMRSEACEATRVRGVQSERLLDLRMRCLDRRLGKVQSLTNIFAHESSDDVVKQALPAVYALPPIEACGDKDALMAARPPPDSPKLAAEVDALRARLDRVEALKESGSYKEGLKLAAAVVADCRSVDYPPLLAEALSVLGYLQNRSGQSAAADKSLSEAILVGSRAGEDRVVADAWNVRIYNLGQQGRYADALAIREAAEAAVERAGAEPLVRGAFLGYVGTIFNRQEKYAEARPYFEKAIAIEQAALGPDHPSLAAVLSNLGNVLGGQDDADGARKSYERSIAIYEKAYGPHHPLLAVPLNNLGNLLSDHGQYEEARQRYLRAIAIWETSIGPDTPNIANALNCLGSNSIEQARYDEAWSYFERARAIWQRTVEPNHPDLGMVETNLGEVLLRKKHPAEALPYFERSLAMEQKTLDATDPSLAFPLTGMGECLLKLGRTAEALPPLERALHIREAAGSRPAVLVDTRFTLASALGALGRDRARATQLARRAYADAAAVGTPAGARAHAEIGAWLADRR